METYHTVINHTENYSLDVVQFINALDLIIDAAIDYGDAASYEDGQVVLHELDKRINNLLSRFGISVDWNCRNGHIYNKNK